MAFKWNWRVYYCVSEWCYSYLHFERKLKPRTAAQASPYFTSLHPSICGYRWKSTWCNSKQKTTSFSCIHKVHSSIISNYEAVQSTIPSSTITTVQLLPTLLSNRTKTPNTDLVIFHSLHSSVFLERFA